MKHPAARETILSFPWKITIYKKSMSIPNFLSNGITLLFKRREITIILGPDLAQAAGRSAFGSKTCRDRPNCLTLLASAAIQRRSPSGISENVKPGFLLARAAGNLSCMYAPRPSLFLEESLAGFLHVWSVLPGEGGNNH
jgi:hypothetical protein